MEDFSLALPGDGQELGSSHGFWGKLISNEGFSLWIRIAGLEIVGNTEKSSGAHVSPAFLHGKDADIHVIYTFQVSALGHLGWTDWTFHAFGCSGSPSVRSSTRPCS